MKFETRVELIVLLVAAIVVGGWIGLRIARRSSAPENAAASAQGTQVQRRTPAVMTAPRGMPVQVNPTANRSRTVTPPSTPAAIIERSAPIVPRTLQIVEESPTPKTVAPVTSAPSKKVEKAAALMKEGKRYEARAMLTKLILKTPEGNAREQMHAMLDEINAVLFFSRAPSPDAEMYTIQRGDMLASIVKRYEKDYYYTDLVMQINNIPNAARIRAGQKIKIPKGTFAAIVQKRSHRLIVVLNGHYIKEYSIGLGAPGSETPAALFAVANNKQVNPDWTSPDGHVYKYGDPRNILGTRWIGFRETDQHQGYGIHGTNDESTIGKDVSNGCIRMLKKDVEELFTMLGPGDAVNVVD